MDANSQDISVLVGSVDISKLDKWFNLFDYKDEYDRVTEFFFEV
jgi:predicted Ser/Thr protein kinase